MLDAIRDKLVKALEQHENGGGLAHVTIFSNEDWIVYDDDCLTVAHGDSLCSLAEAIDLEDPAVPQNITVSGRRYVLDQ